MSDTFRPNLGKLLRVLVAGGMALVGGATVRAQEKPSPPAQTGGGEKPAQDGAAQKDQDAQKAQAEKDKKKADEEKKKAEQAKKSSQPDGGGVKGW
jgi:hypothetical protein